MYINEDGNSGYIYYLQNVGFTEYTGLTDYFEYHINIVQMYESAGFIDAGEQDEFMGVYDEGYVAKINFVKPTE